MGLTWADYFSLFKIFFSDFPKTYCKTFLVEYENRENSLKSTSRIGLMSASQIELNTSLCSLVLQNFKILNSCQNKWMHELLYQNEWVAIFYHYYEVYHANVCKIQNSSFMHKCVFLLRPHKWLDFNDALIFFFSVPHTVFQWREFPPLYL